MTTAGNPNRSESDTGIQPDNQAPTQDTLEVNWEKRYKDLQSYHDKTRSTLETQLKQLKDETGTLVLPRTQEELEDFKTRNPEHYGTIETIANQLVEQRLQPLQDNMKEAKREAAMAKLSQAHPDWQEFAGNENFLAWAEAEGLTDWVSEEFDASKPIRAITFYKMFLQSNKQEDKPKRSTVDPAAQAVNVNSGAPTPTGNEGLRSYTRQQIERMSVVEYEHNLESIQAAQAAGLILDK